jgi:hypothetical protein
MNPADEERHPKVIVAWNAGRTEWGKRGFDNFLIGASWSHWGNWPERQAHIYLGLWTLTVITPSKGGKIRRDLGRK